jgi:hypothetical protein
MKFKEGDILKLKDNTKNNTFLWKMERIVILNNNDYTDGIKQDWYSEYYIRIIKPTFQYSDSPIRKWSEWFVDEHFEIDIKEQRKNKLNKIKELK